MKMNVSLRCLCFLIFWGAGTLLMGDRLLVEYGFADLDNATRPLSVDEAITAGPFMMNSFFPPHREYFDGSMGGEPGEAMVTNRPQYYEFTVRGLSAVDGLDRLEVKITTRRRHAATRHRITVESFANQHEPPGPLTFDFYEGDEIEGEPKARGREDITVGQSGEFLGWEGNSGFLVVDLTELELADVMTFRINFEDERGRSRTAVREVRLFGR